MKKSKFKIVLEDYKNNFTYKKNTTNVDIQFNRIAFILSGLTPYRLNRVTVSFNPKPQSTSNVVISFWTTNEFPELPLPREQKRTTLDVHR